ncbi:MAG: hypothetical protein QXH90_04560 [Candidatus Korarchaeum sp.]
MRVLRAPPKFVYIRWMGLLTTLIPTSGMALLYLTSPSPREGLIYAITVSLPLLVFSYYLDVLIRLIPMPERIKHPFPRVWISWTVAYPIARLGVSEPLLTRLVGPTMSLSHMTLIAMIFMGAMYGVFFYTAYIVLFRIYVRRKLSRGTLPDSFY